MNTRLPLLLLMLFPPFFTSQSSAQSLLLENATLLDPAQQSQFKGFVWIEGDTIHQVSQEAPAAYEGERLDLTGKFLLPGFMDMHIHSWGNLAPGNQMEFLMTEKTAQRMLYCGVTGFLDLFSAEAYILALRDKQRTEGMMGADIYCSGPILTCTGGHGTEYGVPTRVVNNPEEAAREIGELAPKRPDVIKLVYDHVQGRMPSMDQATMAAIIEQAHLHDIKVVAHIGTWEDVRDVVAAGGDAVTHTPTGAAPPEVLALMKEKGTYIIPTLTVQSELMHFLDQPEILDRPLLQASTTARLIDAYRDSSKLDLRMKRWLAYQRGSVDETFASIRKLNEAGIPILAGTDCGNPGTFQGFSLHRELELLVKGGLSPWQALAAGSSLGATFLDQSIGFKPGDRANLVVLNQSPLADIRNSQDIHLVIHHGQVIDREALLKGESSKPAQAAKPAPKWTEVLLADFTGERGKWEAQSDQVQGGQSAVYFKQEAGKATINGKLRSGGGFAWASMQYTFTEDEKPQDISAFQGLKIRIKTQQAGLYVSMLTAEVTNFDYPLYLLPPGTGEWQELELPFAEFKQFQAKETVWTGKQVMGFTIGASGQGSSEFEFVLDRVELY